VLISLALVGGACGDGDGGETASPSPGSIVSSEPVDAFLLYREASGSLIAQSLESGETFRQEVDFSKEIVIAAQCTNDGSRIAYLRQAFSSIDRTLDIRGKDAPDDPLTVPPTTQDFTWSSDGAQLAVVDYDGQAQEYEISLMDPSTGERQSLASGDGFAGAVAWSPDGSRLAFNHQTIEDPVSLIFTVDPSGGEPEPLLPEGDLQWYDPDWSPDGAGILVSGGNEDGFQLYTIDPSSGDYEAITDSDIFKRGAQYSPDGLTIAYTGSLNVPGVATDWRALHQFGIFLADADGANERPITADPRLNPGAAVDPYLDAYFVGWCAPGPWLDDLWEPGAAITPTIQ
jgi:Tol biopolymer transport system component